METGVVYRFEDLKRMIIEGTEAKPLKGIGIEKTNKEEQEKELKSAKEKAEKLSAGRKFNKPEINNHPTDYNKTMIDGIKFTEEPSKEWKNRVEAQVQGYNSIEEKENAQEKDYDPSLEFSGDRFYKSRKEIDSERNDAISAKRHAGLKAREEFEDDDECRPYGAFEKEKSKMKNESVKRLHFKNTVFLSEEQALARVPDDFKHQNGRFFMRDANGTDFLVECKIDDKFGYASLRVVSSMNKSKINEQLDRMRELFNYDRRNENVKTDFQRTDVNEMVDKIKKMS